MRRCILIMLVTAASVALASCGLGPLLIGWVGGPGTGGTMSFDLVGAQAIAGTGEQNRSIASRGISDETEAALVKILEDGTIESAIDFGGAGWAPTISFMSIGEDGSVYVGFEHDYWFYDSQFGSNRPVQLVRLYPDTTNFDVVWPPTSMAAEYDFPRIETWGWWGMEQDPMVKGPNGELYFKVVDHSSASANHIYVYDPETRAEPVQVTPEGVNLMIGYFAVDSKGRLYIQGGGSDGTSSFMRVYPRQADGTYESFKNIYYSSDGSSYIRSFAVSPSKDFAVVNGYNINGNNGIIKFSLEGDAVSTELLYGDLSSSYIQLARARSDTWSWGTDLALFDSGIVQASTFSWAPQVKSDLGDYADINKVIERIRPYFYDEPTFTGTADDEEFVTGQALGGFAASDGTRALYQHLLSDGRTFLETYFNGQLFSDWLQDAGLSGLSVDNISTLLWLDDGSLYGLYNQAWGSSTEGATMIRLLDPNGNRDLRVVELVHSDKKPSMMQIVGDYLYYRYANMSGGSETGTHRIARVHIASEAEEQLYPASLSDREILSYDVASDNETLWFAALDQQTNQAETIKLDLTTGTYEVVESSIRLSNIKVIE